MEQKSLKKQDLQSATRHKQELQQKHKTSFPENSGIQLTHIFKILDKIASDLPLKPYIFWTFWSQDWRVCGSPFIGHLAAFPAANMAVKSRSTGSGASKSNHPKFPADQEMR